MYRESLIILSQLNPQFNGAILISNQTTPFAINPYLIEGFQSHQLIKPLYNLPPQSTPPCMFVKEGGAVVVVVRIVRISSGFWDIEVNKALVFEVTSELNFSGSLARL